jgi:hypothetical protein
LAPSTTSSPSRCRWAGGLGGGGGEGRGWVAWVRQGEGGRGGLRWGGGDPDLAPPALPLASAGIDCPPISFGESDTPPSPATPLQPAPPPPLCILANAATPPGAAAQEGIDAISDVIYHIETFDVTTIRASTPMFLMSRKIKALGVKMVLSGGWRAGALGPGARSAPKHVAGLTSRADASQVGSAARRPGWCRCPSPSPAPAPQARCPWAAAAAAARRAAPLPAEQGRARLGTEGRRRRCRRGQRRGVWRLPVLPQGAQPGGVPERVRAQGPGGRPPGGAAGGGCCGAVCWCFARPLGRRGCRPGQALRDWPGGSLALGDAAAPLRPG